MKAVQEEFFVWHEQQAPEFSSDVGTKAYNDRLADLSTAVFRTRYVRLVTRISPISVSVSVLTRTSKPLEALDQRQAECPVGQSDTGQRTHDCVRARARTHTHKRAHTRTYTYTYTHTHAQTYKCTHMHNTHTHTHTHTYIHTHIHTHTHTNAHIHTHTHTTNTHTVTIVFIQNAFTLVCRQMDLCLTVQSCQHLQNVSLCS